MKKIIFVALLICSSTMFYFLQDDSTHVTNTVVLDEKDYYSTKVQPIFDANCIACHSCYNSPCQLNLTSYDATIRGAHSISIYDFPKLVARDPSRMYIDAGSEKEWRKKGFYSVVSHQSESLLTYMVSQPHGIESGKQKVYESEESRVCTTELDEDQLQAYNKVNPAGRMPFGFPSLKESEIEVIKTWQELGTPGPDYKRQEKVLSQIEELRPSLQKWEEFFNRDSLKAQLASRYIYEHLFLANIYFESHPKLSYRLVRSKTESGQVQEIATTYPFDDPKQKFYYRLRPVLGTIVHKSYLPFMFSKEKMEKWNKDFYNSKWSTTPKKMPAYGRDGANPYKVFKDIPVKARYQFFLDESTYHIMTFIKGPVCRGQTALNVINDHFWVFFVEPNRDPLVNSDEVYDAVAKEMVMPAQLKGDFNPLVDLREGYWRAVEKKYEYLNSKKLDLDWIWDGEGQDDDASITVMRHFDSANVMKGLQGQSPKTIWVIDYHVFESIYYNLVAGYNVFGPVLHQLNSRLFMEISRITSEDLFLSFLPKEQRVKMRSKWNSPTPKKNESTLKWLADTFTQDASEEMKYKYKYHGEDIKSSLELSQKNPKEDFLKLITTKRLNTTQTQAGRTTLKSERLKLTEVKSKGIQSLPDTIILKYEGEVYTLVHNKDHYNVSMLLFEEERRNPENDSIDIIRGVATSYPNLFMELDRNELKSFTQELNNSSSSAETSALLKKYGILRSRANFWDYYKDFSNNTYEGSTNEYGKLDLNRYMNLL